VGDLVIHEIHHPARIQKKILQILRDQGVNAASAPTAAHHTTDPQQATMQEDEAES
jgi:hypothetical protein